MIPKATYEGVLNFGIIEADVAVLDNGQCVISIQISKDMQSIQYKNMAGDKVIGYILDINGPASTTDDLVGYKDLETIKLSEFDKKLQTALNYNPKKK